MAKRTTSAIADDELGQRGECKRDDREAWSNGPSRRRALTAPITIASGMLISADEEHEERRVPIRSPSTSVTGRPATSDVPRSTCDDPHSQSVYCSTTGLSRPSCSRSVGERLRRRGAAQDRPRGIAGQRLRGREDDDRGDEEREDAEEEAPEDEPGDATEDFRPRADAAVPAAETPGERVLLTTASADTGERRPVSGHPRRRSGEVIVRKLFPYLFRSSVPLSGFKPATLLLWASMTLFEAPHDVAALVVLHPLHLGDDLAPLLLVHRPSSACVVERC